MPEGSKWVAFHTYLRERRGKKTISRGISQGSEWDFSYGHEVVFFEEESLTSLGMERLFFTNCFYP